MKTASKKYIKAIADIFSSNSNPVNALPMAKYMKFKFEYFGLKKPEREVLVKDFFARYGLPEIDTVEETIKGLWELPQREFQYFALGLLEKSFEKYKANYIELYQQLIISKSWWDTVDMIAGKLVASHFQVYPEQIITVMGRWIDSDNIWLKRSALLFQLKYKGKTNTDLLEKYILKCLGSNEFFINKAIGWILREYSKTNAQWVINFVDRTKLAPLSKREALKWLNNRDRNEEN